MDAQLVIKAAHLLKAARHVVAFTGAGISTPSGIPDFRSPESGLWENVDIFEVATINGFMQNPRAFYDWVHPLIKVTHNAQPNAAHKTLAAWEKAGTLQTIITQNIDGLHSRAGSQAVYELHGHIREATCLQCRVVSIAQPFIEQFLLDNQIPLCKDCGGYIKPNVVLFGEMLPQEQLEGAELAAQRADVMLIIGSSLEVAPASDLPLLALRNNAKLIIVNLQPIPLDNRADVVIRGDAAVVLPEIQKHLGA